MAGPHAASAHGARAFPVLHADVHRQQAADSPRTTGDTRVGAALAEQPLAVGTSFTGTTLAESGFVPPDAMGAVGPSQFLVGVNGRIKVFSKTGVLGSLNTSLDTFFGSVVTPGEFTGDPEVRYDMLSGKWFVLCIDSAASNNRILLAVSDTGTITGGTVWSFFQFQQNLISPAGDTGDIADFPTLGIDANALYVGANMFNGTTGDFVSSTAFVIRKSSVTGAGPIVVSAFRNLDNAPTYDAGPFAPQGVDNADPAATVGYFVGVDNTSFSKLDVLRVSTPGGTPILSGNLAISVPTTRFPLNPTVAGSTKPLAGIDDRLGPASIVNGKLYTAHNIGVDATGTASSLPTRDAVRWYELSNLASTPTLSRSGTIFDSSDTATSYWIPSIATSSQGHSVIGMNTGSASAHPDGAIASMLSGDASFSAPATYTSSSASYNPSFDTGIPLRWGDFSHTSVDPCDGQTFWTIQEYVESTDNWGVKVGKVPAPPPATPASTSPSSVVVGQASTNVTLTGTSASGSGFWDPGSGACRIAASVDGSVTVNSVTYTDPTHVTLNVSTVGATPGNRTIMVTNPDGQTASASVFVVNQAPANTLQPTISGTASAGSILTANAGTWTGFPAPTFTYQWERCNLAGSTCTNIGGATGSTYTLLQSDGGSTIRVLVTGTNVAGSPPAVESAQTPAVTAPPVNTLAPTISGTTGLGDLLTAGNGTWTGYPVPTFTDQWKRCDSDGANCAVIGGATASTHTIVSADQGFRLLVTITATNASGSPSADSATKDVAGAPVNLAVPTTTGTAQVGSTLTANRGSWSGVPAPAFAYQWQRCNAAGLSASCLDLAGSTASTYVPVSADIGLTLRVRVTATNTGGASGPVASVVTALVVAAVDGGGGGGGSSSFDLTLSPSAQTIASGSTATWTISVKNSGGAYLYAVGISDGLAPGCAPPTAYSDTLSFMAPNVTVTYTCTLAGVTAGFTNTVVATATTGPGDKLTQTATASVTVSALFTPPPTSSTPSPPTSKPPRTTTSTVGITRTGTAKADKLIGTPRNDTLDGRGGNDTINGEAGNDKLIGGLGKDAITGGLGQDSISGGAGNDTIHAHDGARDTIDCGTGHDIVFADKIDKVAKNCEVVHRS